jgi:hypothetical protein
MKTIIITFILLMILTGCQPQNTAQLPTLAQIAAATLTPFNDPTLPAEWTATPSPTHTPQPTITGTLTITPSATITETPTRTLPPTETPTVESPPREDLIEIALQTTLVGPTVVWPLPPTQDFFGTRPGIQPTVTPIGFLPSPTPPCTMMPSGGFLNVYNQNPTLASQLGCPSAPAQTINDAYQPFERGAMLWIEFGTPPAIFAFANDARFTRADDTYNASTDPYSGGETPPQGLVEPVRGFGKVWRGLPAVRQALGWATAMEAGGQATMQLFGRGLMIAVPQRGQILVLIYDANSTFAGTWQGFAGGY